MTIRDLIDFLGNNPLILLAVFIVLPATAWLYGIPLSRRKAGEPPHCYFYATLVYLAVIPGAFALVLTGYSLFFLRSDLMSLNLLVFFLPVVSMVVTLVIINSRVELDRLPGFRRITGLFVLLVITCILALFMQKTRIWLLFHGSMTGLVIFMVLLFLGLRWGAGRLLGRRR